MVLSVGVYVFLYFHVNVRCVWLLCMSVCVSVWLYGCMGVWFGAFDIMLLGKEEMCV